MLTGETAQLRRVAEEYFHTRTGAEAVNELASLAFDGSAFLAAGDAWQRLYRSHRTGELDRAMLLAKAAVAYHLGGDSVRARALGQQIKDAHGQERIRIAGRDVSAAGFVAEALATAQPASGRGAVVSDWTCLAGTAAGTAVMPPVEAGVFPLWSQPDGAAARQAQAWQVAGLTGGQAERSRAGLQVVIEKGRAVLTLALAGQAKRAFVLPAVIHPLVVGDLVICRVPEEVAAYRLSTGKLVWRTKRLPVYRDVQAEETPNALAPLAGDMGRFALSYGGDMVYTVCRMRFLDQGSFRRYGTDGEPDSATMAALSAGEGGGQVVWEVGNGKGGTELLRNGKFLTAPTYAGGMLYVLAKYANSYWAACLNAKTGESMWETQVGGMPLTGGGGSWQASYTVEVLTERGSPPAVADGRVYVTTNAGLVAALSAETGQPAWGYQYDSSVAGVSGAGELPTVSDRAYAIVSLKRPLLPANPLIVSAGRVICLPADSASVLAFSAEDGALLWQRSRDHQEDLSAVDGGRVLLSGPDVTFVRAGDGGVIKSVPGEVSGRPAVTAEAVLASGAGKVMQVDLRSYSAVEVPLMDEQAQLGQLISAGGRLVVAGPSGVGAYFGFDDAWQSTTKRLAAADTAAQRLDVRLLRGRFALAAGKVGVAAAEFRAAEGEAARAGPDAAAQVRPWLYRLAMSQVETAKDDAAAGRLLADARKYAAGAGEEANVLLRTVAYHEAFGRAADAAGAAQALAEKYEKVVVTETGPGESPVTGYAAGQREIARLIRKHGRAAYGAADRQADQAAKGAIAKGDVEAMLAVQRRWPRAAAAEQLLLTAAEALYRKATTAPGDRELLARAHRVLGEVRNFPSEQAALSARAGQAMITSRANAALGTAMAADLAAAPAGGTVKFGDYQGPAGGVAQRLPRGQAGVIASGVGLAHLGPALREVYRMPMGGLTLLRDTRGDPVVLGSRVFFTHSSGLLCIDAEIDDDDAAVVWKADLPQVQDFRGRTGQLSADLRLMAIVDMPQITVLETRTGRVVHRRTFGQLGIDNWVKLTGAGDVLAFLQWRGVVTGVDFAQGKVLWERPTVRGNTAAVTLRSRDETLLLGEGKAVEGYHSSWTALDLRSGTAAEAGSASSRLRTIDMLVTADGSVAWIGSARVGLSDPRRGVELWSAPLPPGHSRLLGGGEGLVAARTADGNALLVGMEAALDPCESGPPPAAAKAGKAGRAPRPGAGAPVVHGAFSRVGKGLVLDLPRREGGARMLPRSAELVGGRGYLLLTGAEPPGMGASGEPWAGVTVQAIELPGGKTLWTRELAPPSAGACLVSAARIAGCTMGVLLRPLDSRRPPALHVVDLATGGSIDVTAAMGGAGGPKIRPAGNPGVVLNGRVVVELEDGFALLRSEL